MKRKADGTLQQIGRMPENDGWLREGGPEYRAAVIAKTNELDRPLTEGELAELRKQYNQ